MSIKIFFCKIWFEPIFFTGSLAVWKDCGEAASPIFLSSRRLRRREDENKFELYSIYTASQDFSSG